VITPPPPAFGIWGPIFAACLANGIDGVLPGRGTSDLDAAAGWPLAGAAAANTAWSVAVQADRFAVTPAILPVAAGCAAVAYRRIQGAEAPARRSAVPVTTGLLLGWTTLASTVNAVAVLHLTRIDQDGPAVTAAATAAVAGLAGVAATTVARSRRGALPLAAATAWGLATTAATRARPAPTRIATGLGALAVLGAAAANRLNWRRTPT
jgi:hypothetical protein